MEDEVSLAAAATLAISAAQQAIAAPPEEAGSLSPRGP